MKRLLSAGQQAREWLTKKAAAGRDAVRRRFGSPVKAPAKAEDQGLPPGSESAQPPVEEVPAEMPATRPGNRHMTVLAIVSTLAIGAGVGLAYWWPMQKATPGKNTSTKTAIKQGGAAGEADDIGAGPGDKLKLLYYRDPTGLPYTSPIPMKDPEGRDYIPVYEGDDGVPEVSISGTTKPAAKGSAAAPQAAKPKGKQGAHESHAGHAGHGGNDAYSGAGKTQGAGQKARAKAEPRHNADAPKVAKKALKTEAVVMRELDDLAPSVSGRIHVDDRRVFIFTPRFEGWIDQLHVGATGQAIRRGEPLFRAYSPELDAAQRDFLIAQRAAKAAAKAGSNSEADLRGMAQASLGRLGSMGMSDQDIARLRESGKPLRAVTMSSPASGVVMEKSAVRGMRFSAGDKLYRIVDLNSVWVVVDLPQGQAAKVMRGQIATLRFPDYPGQLFHAKVVYIAPSVHPKTRTTTVRLQLDNPDGHFKPGMQVDAQLFSQGGGRALAVPLSAVISKGSQRIVLVRHRSGRIVPREVRLGARSASYAAVTSGLSEGERVVLNAAAATAANAKLRGTVDKAAKRPEHVAAFEGKLPRLDAPLPPYGRKPDVVSITYIPGTTLD